MNRMRLILERVREMPAMAQVVVLAMVEELQDLQARVAALESLAKSEPAKRAKGKPELVKLEKPSEKKP